MENNDLFFVKLLTIYKFICSTQSAATGGVCSTQKSEYDATEVEKISKVVKFLRYVHYHESKNIKRNNFLTIIPFNDSNCRATHDYVLNKFDRSNHWIKQERREGVYFNYVITSESFSESIKCFFSKTETRTRAFQFGYRKVYSENYQELKDGVIKIKGCGFSGFYCSKFKFYSRVVLISITGAFSDSLRGILSEIEQLKKKHEIEYISLEIEIHEMFMSDFNEIFDFIAEIDTQLDFFLVLADLYFKTDPALPEKFKHRTVYRTSRSFFGIDLDNCVTRIVSASVIFQKRKK